MRIAIIDIGTNTFNLLIRNTENSELLYADKISVRLGDGGLNNNTISPPAFERGIEALKKHRETCLEYKADHIYAFATSAVRTAGNGAFFVQKVKEDTGIEINVIDGDKEAELIYYGVRQGVELPNDNVLIMDIGGGSTEFIIANAENAVWKKSYLLGSSRLMEKFRPSDPIQGEEIEALHRYFESELEDLFEKIAEHPVKQLIGSSGSFDTLAAMTVHKFQEPQLLEGRTTYTFDLYEYMNISQLMMVSDFETRLNTPGMVPMRADIIVMACIQINFILKRLGIKSIIQSNYALKEGVFKTLENDNILWQRSLL